MTTVGPAQEGKEGAWIPAGLGLVLACLGKSPGSRRMELHGVGGETELSPLLPQLWEPLGALWGAQASWPEASEAGVRDEAGVAVSAWTGCLTSGLPSGPET